MAQEMKPATPKTREVQLKRASNAALYSLLNLTILPVIAFIGLLLLYKKTEPGTIDRYHAALGIKINMTAAVVLFAVSALMILLGGFDSPWTWVYVISYFTLVHTIFIIIAVWALVRSWSGEKLRDA
jgi:threonine/homoserine/homoserine lactone efflux protein